MKIVKKILTSIIMIILCSILFVSGVILINSYAKPNEVPSFFGWKPFIVLSGSMETQIMTGDVVVVKEIDAKKLKENDIIAFKEDNNIVITHRIIEIIKDENGDTKYKTKGDNNNIEDNYEIKKEEILGKVCFHIKKIGNIVSYIKSRKGFINVIILIIILFLIKNKIDSKKITRKEKRKKYEIKKLRDQYYSK